MPSHTPWALCPPEPSTSPAPVGPNHSRSAPGPGFRQALSPGSVDTQQHRYSPSQVRKLEAGKASEWSSVTA